MSFSRTLALSQRPARTLRAVALSGLLAVGVAASGPAASAQAASAGELEGQGVTQIIVKRRADLSVAERADVRADADVELVRQLMLPRAEVVAVEPGELDEALAALRSDPDVVYAEPDAMISAAADPHWADQWGLENSGQSIYGSAGSADADVDALDAWRASTGAGQTVAIIDSGIEFGHPDLAGQIAVNPGESGAKATNGVDDDRNGFVDDARGWDWIGKESERNPTTGTVPPPVGEDNDPSDVAGHGTHVAGIIAAKRDNGIGVAGIAPDARVLPLRVLDSYGGGLLSDAVEALYYAGKAGVRVANASLGVPAKDTWAGDSQSLRDAMAANRGTLYVFAAGNANTADPFYPCAIEQDNVLCVGASTNADKRASFSNHGAAWVDLYAPGQHIRSTYRNGGYAWLSGTSMSAPLAAGTVALVAAANPALGATALKQRALDGADRKTALADSATGGRLNAAAAVALANPPVTDSTPGGDIPPPTRTTPPVEAPAPTVQITEPSGPAPAPATPLIAPAPPASATPPAPASVPAPRAPAGPAVGGAPVLSDVVLSTRRLRRSLTVRFRVDRASVVRMTASRKVCRAGRCTYKTARTWTAAARAGTNAHVLRRSAGGRRLAAGAYRLTVQAVDGAQRSAARALPFSVR